LTRQVGDLHTEALCLGNLGLVEQDQGRPKEARALLEEALDLIHQIGDRHTEGEGLGQLGDLLRQAFGALPEASALLSQAEALLAEVGDPVERAKLLCRQGHLLLAKDQSAHALLAEAERVARESQVGPKSELGRLLGRLSLAQLAWAAGQTDLLFRG